MNIFDIIEGIAFTKKANPFTNFEEEKEYQPFLVNRWLSMLDPLAARIINDTLNRFGKNFDNIDQYKFLSNILPKYRKQRIHYIKKPAKGSTS